MRFAVSSGLRATRSRTILAVAAAAALAAVAFAATPPLQVQQAAAPAEVKGAASGKGAPTALALPAVRGPFLAPLGQGFVPEVEPNGTSATATPLGGTDVVVRANVFPNGDLDFFSFVAAAGDRVYAATMTSGSSNGSTDSQLDVLDVDGTTSLEFDDDNGVLGGLSSTIAGTTIPAAGTYFLRVKHFSATNQLRPYHLHFRLQSGAPTPETEPNDTPGTADPLPAGGWVSGARDPAAAAEQDWYSFTASAGDTVFLSLDLDPERDATTWNGRLGVALFGDATNQILVVDDAGAGDPDSEALFMTVKAAGTYYAFVDSASAATGGPTATYHLSASIHPAVDEGLNCTTYTSTDAPQAIGPGAGTTSSTITVPGNPRIADLDVSLVLDHAQMADIDAHLRSPAGNDNGIFSDIGATATGGQAMMDTVFDDEAAIPPLFTVLRGPSYMPENSYRLDWFDGEDAGGTWTLDLRDDGANASGGTLTSWSLRICEAPPPPPCPVGAVLETVFGTDFEAGDAGFTHSGTADEWELGLPTFAPLASCNSGTSCWATDLDDTYNASSNQDLLSPAIDLSGHLAPVTVSWAQRYHLESASFDHYSVDLQQVGGVNPTRVFEWLGATMNDTVGSPGVAIAESAGWGVFTADASAYAGQSDAQLRFHLDSDTTVQLAGVGIDDVVVTACRPLVADVAITKTDGVATAVPGGSVTYTIVASNAGPDGVVGATVSDVFPPSLTCTWTCVGAGGGTCTAGPVAGNINDSVDLPSGASATYTATCAVSPAATGSLVNTATIASGIDTTPGNNSATDTDTLTPTADLSITKTDGLATATPGQAIVYTIVAANPGPSDVVGATVADNFPASLTGVTWTCVGAGGGTCTAAGAGAINDVVNLPAGGSVTYTVSATIDGAFTGLLSNTATVTAPGGVTDPTAGNNSATDTTTVQGGASVSGTKSVSGDFSEGGTIFYTVTLVNSGNLPQGDNPGDEFTDVLPAGLTLVGATATSGTAVATVGTNTVTWNGSLAAGGGSVTITIEAVVEPGTGGTTISNQGTIAYDGDGDGTNESSAVTDDPAAGGATDPTDFVVGGGGQVPIIEIPTVSELGLVLLALALAVAMAWTARRRRTTG